MKTYRSVHSIVKQIVKEKNEETVTRLIGELMQLQKQAPLPEKCQLRNTDGSLEFLYFNDICFATADRFNTLITVWRNNKTEQFLYGANIGELDKELRVYGFLRVHESYIVNPGCIVRNKKEVNKLLMISGHEVAVSKSHRPMVAELFPVIKAPSRMPLSRAMQRGGLHKQ